MEITIKLAEEAEGGRIPAAVEMRLGGDFVEIDGRLEFTPFELACLVAETADLATATIRIEALDTLLAVAGEVE